MFFPGKNSKTGFQSASEARARSIVAGRHLPVGVMSRASCVPPCSPGGCHVYCMRVSVYLCIHYL